MATLRRATAAFFHLLWKQLSSYSNSVPINSLSVEINKKIVNVPVIEIVIRRIPREKALGAFSFPRFIVPT